MLVGKLKTVRSFARGFTLIELIIVVAIVAVLLGIGVPSFKSFVAGQRVKTAAADFSLSAVQTRSEAIKRNAEFGLVAAAGGWRDGWSVKSANATVSTQQPYKGLNMSSPNDFTEIVYLGTGRLKSQSDPPPSLQISGDSGSPVRCVTFELSGMPKIKLGAC